MNECMTKMPFVGIGWVMGTSRNLAEIPHARRYLKQLQALRGPCMKQTPETISSVAKHPNHEGEVVLVYTSFLPCTRRDPKGPPHGNKWAGNSSLNLIECLWLEPKYKTLWNLCCSFVHFQAVTFHPCLAECFPGRNSA